METKNSIARLKENFNNATAWLFC